MHAIYYYFKLDRRRMCIEVANRLPRILHRLSADPRASIGELLRDGLRAAEVYGERV